MLAHQEAVLQKPLRNASVYARFIQSWINMIVVDDGPGVSSTVKKEPTKLSPGKKNSTQTKTNILVLQDSEWSNKHINKLSVKLKIVIILQ